jgi:hypothetical protein
MTQQLDVSTDDQNSCLKVFLYRGGAPVAKGVLRYLGMLGMVVDPGPGSYPRNTHLEVELIRKTLEGLKRCRLPVIVSKSSKAGLMLVYQGNKAYDCDELKDMILQHSPGVAPA